MSDLMDYKGYFTKIEYSKKDNVLFGCIQGIEDKILFEGKSIEEFEQAFHESVDDYLELCAEYGKEPEKIYKGSFNVRITPELHRDIAKKAYIRDMSLNEAIEKAIKFYVEYDLDDILCQYQNSYENEITFVDKIFEQKTEFVLKFPELQIAS